MNTLDLFKQHEVSDIYVPPVNYTYIYSQKLFNDNFDKIMGVKDWVVDTETTGLDFLTNEITLLQIGDPREQYVIDTRVVEIDRLREPFEDDTKGKLLTNATFDYLMLRGSKQIVMNCIYDTYMAEKVLTAGYLKRGYGMADTALKYCGLIVDKEMQKSFIGHTGPYSERQIKYAALDCVYPYKIFEKQQKLLRQWGLWDAFMIECEAIPAFGDSAFYGMTLNEGKWVSNIITEQKKSKEASEKFMAISAKHSGEDLFGRSTININSPAQMLSYLQERFGAEDLKDRDGKPGTGVEILEALVEKHGEEDTEDIKQILKVRGCEKRVGTYGYTYTNHVHPADGMFHPRVEQLGTDTGRPSGKKPNMLNIPSETQYREPWEAPEGFKFLNDDYGACELRIMASLSGDPVMCEGFRSGQDFHTYTASQFVKDNEQFERELIINDEAGKHKYGDFILDASGNKKENPYLGKLVPYDRVLKIMRVVAKTINFGLAYGMGPAALAARLGITIELAREYIKQYNETFSVLVAWLEKQRAKALTRRAYTMNDYNSAENKKRIYHSLGYSETPSGRKRFYVLPIEPLEIKKADGYMWRKEGSNKVWYNDEIGSVLPYDPKDSWNKELKRLADKGDITAKRIKTYYSKIASIQREAGNAPIQGTNADMTKIAMYLFRKFIRQYEKDHNNGMYIGHIALQVYDELLVIAREDVAEMFGDKLTECMIEAGDRFIKNVPVEADCVVANTWVH